MEGESLTIMAYISKKIIFTYKCLITYKENYKRLHGFFRQSHISMFLTMILLCTRFTLAVHKPNEESSYTVMIVLQSSLQ